MKHIVIINFTGDRGNWGCQATSYEFLRFGAGLFDANEELRFSAVPLLGTTRTDVDADSQIDRVYDSFEAVGAQTADAQTALEFLTDIAKERYAKYVDVIKSADLILFQAEGSMGMGADFTRGPRLMLLPFVAKHAWGRRVVALNQTFYSHDPKVLKNAVTAFSSFDFYAFRESASVAFAKSVGLTKACLVPDLAFMSGANLAQTSSVQDKDCFSVTGSALKDPQRYDHIVEQTKRIARETGLKPMVAVSRDYQLSLASYTKLSGLGTKRVPRKRSYQEVTKLLSQTAFLLGGRYHMSIMAAAGMTANVLLTGNSFKNEGLAHLLGSERPVRSFDDTDGVVEDAVYYFENQTKEQERVATNLSVLRCIIARAQSHIRAILQGEAPGLFEDGFAPMEIDSQAILDRYRQYGSGKPKTRSALQLAGTALGERWATGDVTQDIYETLKDFGRQGDADFEKLVHRLSN